VSHFPQTTRLTGESKQPRVELRPRFAQEYYDVGGKLYYVVKVLDATIDPNDFGVFPEGERVDAAPP